MADPIQDPARSRPALRTVWLAGRWGLVAMASLAAAIHIARTETGERRLADLTAGSRGEAELPAATVAALAAVENNRQQMEDALRALTAERRELAARVGRLEQMLDSVTGSVARLSERPAARIAIPASTPTTVDDAPPKPVAVLPPTTAPAASSPTPQPVAPGFVLLEPALGLNRMPITPEASDAVWSGVPMPRSAARPQPLHTGSVATHRQDPAPDARAAARPDYGIDLGGASTVEALRAAWAAHRGRIPELGKLTPAVSSRQGSQPGAPQQLRLLAGPLPSAAAAAQVCAMLAAQRVTCQPAVYDGQPLALR